MHLPAKANSLTVQTFMANKSFSDSDSDSGMPSPETDVVTFSLINHTNPKSSLHFLYLLLCRSTDLTPLQFVHPIAQQLSGNMPKQKQQTRPNVNV